MLEAARPDLLAEIKETETALKECEQWLDENLLSINQEIASRLQVEQNRRTLINKRLDKLETEYRNLFEEARTFWNLRNVAAHKAAGIKTLHKAKRALENLKTLKQIPAGLTSFMYEIESDIKERNSHIKRYEFASEESIFASLLPPIKES
jgi:hypothetical protein